MKIFLKGDRIDEGDIVKDFGKIIRTTGGYEREVIYPHPTSFVAFINTPKTDLMSSKELAAQNQKIDDICKALSQFFDQAVVQASAELEECAIKMLHSWGHQIIVAYGSQWKLRNIQPQIIVAFDSPVQSIMNVLFTETVKFRGGF